MKKVHTSLIPNSYGLLANSTDHPLAPYIASGFCNGTISWSEAVRAAKQAEFDLFQSRPSLWAIDDWRFWKDCYHRAEHVGRICIAYWDWDSWNWQKKIATMWKVILGYLQKIVPLTTPSMVALAQAQSITQALETYMYLKGGYSAPCSTLQECYDLIYTETALIEKVEHIELACQVWIDAVYL